ncbi:MAG: hypothetical protein ACHQK8_03295 [Bacteroidia bacterium]
MQKSLTALLIFSAILFSSCSSSRFVKPLDEGQQCLTAGFGGPLITLNSLPIPIPLTNICYARGFAEQFTAFGSLHTTSLLFGVGHIEVGGLKGILKNDGLRPGMSVSASFQYMLDRWEWNSRFYPQLDANVYWTYGKNKNLVYAGSNNLFDFNGTHPDGQQQLTLWFPGFHIGHTFVRPKSNYQIEFKYLATNISNQRLVVDYVGKSSMNTGAFGLYFTYHFKF